MVIEQDKFLTEEFLNTIIDEEKKLQQQDAFKQQNFFAPIVVKIPINENNYRYYVEFNQVIIGTGMVFVEVIDLLKNAKEGDVFEMNIATVGGSVPATIELLSAMTYTKAAVITKARGICASCGAFIWSYGKRLLISDYASVMYHATLHLDFGKTLDIKEQAEAVHNKFKALMKVPLEKGLITEEEYIELEQHKRNIYIPSKVMRERI